jgi:NADH pyrophosphatase NudC (nudix superfamily)
LFEMITRWLEFVDIESQGRIQSNPRRSPGRIPEEVLVVEQDRKREDEWFLQNERQLLEAARIARLAREQDRAAKEIAEEARRLKDLHFMKCPKCGHDMEETIEGVSADRCTHCEGLFLDAGELEQVLTQKDDQRRGFFRKLVKI